MTAKCPYRDLFGKPGTGVHAYRFLDIAIFDYIATIFLSVVVTKLTGIPIVITTIAMFVLGIVLHALVGVNTNSVRFLGLAKQC